MGIVIAILCASMLVYLKSKSEGYLANKQIEYQYSLLKNNSQNNFNNEVKCHDIGEKLFVQDQEKYGIGTVYDPQYHYNKKLDTCLYAVTNNEFGVGLPNAKRMAFTILIKNSLTNETILKFVQNAYEDQEQLTKRQDQFYEKYKELFSN